VISFVTLVQGLGLAYAAGLNVYATIAIVGLAERYDWVQNVPNSLEPFGNTAVIVVALLLAVIEFVATMIPGVSPAWETLHSLIRPPAAAVLAAATSWHSDPALVLLAALLGGAVAIVTHTTNLGVRYAIDTTSETATNAVANVVELIVVVVIALAVWSHPFVTVGIALVAVCAIAITVRLIGRTLRQVFSGRWTPGHGFMQAPRVMERRGGAHEDGEWRE
jgi:hypothetical protein